MHWDCENDFEKEMLGFFSRYAIIKVNSATRELNITNTNTKGCAPRREIGHPVNSLGHFCNGENDHHFGATIVFRFFPLPLSAKKEQ